MHVKNPTFYQITDLHLYAGEEIGSYGKAYDQKAQMDQKCMQESCAIVDAAFQEMIDDKETDVIIISGDLTYDGEKASHDLLLQKLKKLKDAGKRVYVTTATHDYSKIACGFTDQGAFKVEQYPREKLRELYADYGWQEAIAEHTPSFSYVVPIFFTETENTVEPEAPTRAGYTFDGWYRRRSRTPTRRAISSSP